MKLQSADKKQQSYGSAATGVAAAKTQHLIPEGKRLFHQAGMRADKWKLQKDNGLAHTTKENMQRISDKSSH
ncbi:TPA: hypothetical protein ACH3X1_011559 [Trebouxia sp. C0004]